MASLQAFRAKVMDSLAVLPLRVYCSHTQNKHTHKEKNQKVERLLCGEVRLTPGTSQKPSEELRDGSSKITKLAWFSQCAQIDVRGQRSLRREHPDFL